MDNNIADAFYNEDYQLLEKLTGIKAKSQKEFEDKYYNKKGEDNTMENTEETFNLEELTETTNVVKEETTEEVKEEKKKEVSKFCEECKPDHTGKTCFCRKCAKNQMDKLNNFLPKGEYTL